MTLHLRRRGFVLGTAATGLGLAAGAAARLRRRSRSRSASSMSARPATLAGPTRTTSARQEVEKAFPGKVDDQLCREAWPRARTPSG